MSDKNLIYYNTKNKNGYVVLYIFSLLLFYCIDTSFQEFVSSPCMTEIKERSCFIHVDAPGHADNTENLPDSYVIDVK